MRNNLFKSAMKLWLLVLIASACNKDNTGIEVNLAYRLIADKTWYLDYAQTINGNTVSNRTYLGQPTYFINYLKNLATSDSDGLVGVYEIIKNDTAVQIKVQAMTASGNASNYTYEIESIGAKSMIMQYNKNSITTRLFFSTQE